MKNKILLLFNLLFVLLFCGEVSAMNIVFEGVNACGKTTTIEAFKRFLTEKGESFCVVNELKGSPVCNLLSFQKNSFRLTDGLNRTSVYETLLLGADVRFKQEYYGRSTSKINIFDRGFMSVLAYQRFILQQEYPDSFVDFFEPFKKIILFDLMPIKAIVYLKVPIEISIERIKSRGREEPCTLEQINFLKDFKKYYENELIPEMISFGIKVIELDGTTSPEENARIIYEVTKGD